ncbi:glucosaminyl-phosphotidylinositol O-acyltransferase Ecym_6342 [Eremothecium cymbalariae DBVPG|uniref:GPI-anchored wall transfer protein n=1 Tax=Eremothecium cymbalariae (strain CBS 270.75 / DBVPG 7215 / KCTC 17166 / NRRL Y-17582) TaxID=931890 RepID=G8JUD8_ERECY|nr:hypothetical protein Ecym_6342 [Eremothecium cymbalariae DBVPG\
MSALKQRKEEFVAGLSGGSISEINLVTSIALISYFCWHLLKAKSKNVPILTDFFLNWCGLLLSVTIYSGTPISLNILILLPCIAYYLVVPDLPKEKSNKINTQKASNEKYKLVKKPYITAYRGGMLVVTCIAILAVDFPIFPRRFAKVETWGSSLMDLGVGSFVFSNGLVSSRAVIKEEIGITRKPLLLRVFEAFKSSTTLLALGVARTISVKNLQYQEHVTEYGVHWNFFFTLALLPPVMILFDSVSKFIPRILIALFISLISEAFLLFKDGFLNYMVFHPRDTFFNANREGLFSFLGYCAIFLCGQSTGFFVLGNHVTENNLYKPSSKVYNSKSNKHASVWTKLTSMSPLNGLLTWSLIFITMTQFVLSYYPYNISRRFANQPYVLWVAAYNTTFLAGYCLVDSIFKNDGSDGQIPKTLEAINSNGLIIFLLANLLTGLTNMIINTLDTTPASGIAILLAYTSVISLTAMLMYSYKIFIKL